MIPNKDERVKLLRDRGIPLSIFIDAAELAEIWGISRRTIYNWKNEDRLPPYDLATTKPCYWRVGTILTYLESNHA